MITNKKEEYLKQNKIDSTYFLLDKTFNTWNHAWPRVSNKHEVRGPIFFSLVCEIKVPIYCKGFHKVQWMRESVIV